MSDFDDLDDVIGPLRGSATPAELAGETEMVSLMAHAHRTAKGNTMFTSRRARVATLIAAGVIGFGGVAAAGPGGFSLTGSDDGAITVDDTTSTTTEVPADEVEFEDVEDVTTTTESDDVTTTTDGVEEIDAAIEDAAATEALPLVDDPDTAFNEEYCEPGNHGKTVSKAAHGELMVPSKDDETVMVKASVVDAAHSMCGKMDATVDTEEPDVDETEVEAVEETDQTDTEQPTKQHGKPESPGNSAKGSNGNGNGNGKGKSGK